jgi:nucleotidyltransferase substrate binding protein (TIGR01987 family)
MPLDLSSYEKAITSLETALTAYSVSQQPQGSTERELMRDGVIQRFEYTFELAWKLLKRYLEEYGLERVDSLTNRDLFRVGHEQGLLRDAEAWLSYLKSRNLISHTYNPAVAETVYESAKAFLGDARYLLEQLRARAQ